MRESNRAKRSSAVRRETSFSRRHPRVDVIFNVVSGTHDPKTDLAIIKTRLERSFDRIVVWSTTPEKAGEQLGREAIADGASVLVACGGDGTVTAVACAINDVQHTRIPPVLAVVPRGTANAFCGALDIPSDVKGAADMVCSGHIRQIDLPTISCSAATADAPSSMLLLCGIGLEAETIKRADRGMKRAWGILAYAFAGITTTWKQESFTADVKLYDVDDSLMFAGGNVTSGEVTLKGMRLKGLTVANAAPATSVLAQGIGTVRPDDRLLEVVCVASKTPLGMITTMLSMLRSALIRTREKRGNVYGLRARKVHIVCDPPQSVVIDGEDAGLTPVSVELPREGGSVQVVAPKASVVTRRRRRFGRSLIRLWRNVRGVAVLAMSVALIKRARQGSSSA